MKQSFELQLIEAEIASLNELVGLHEAKISALKTSMEKVPDEPEKTRINEKGQRVKVGKQPSKQNAIIDPERLQYFEYFRQKQNVDKTGFETSISLLNEKVVYGFDEEVLTYTFINVKSINRASQGFLVQMAVAVALRGGRIKVVDIYGNDLIEFQTENSEEVIEIRSHPTHSSEDCYLAALTEQGTFYTFYFELRRDTNWK